jgi:hypothetical protein
MSITLMRVSKTRLRKFIGIRMHSKKRAATVM